jgi:hypothetical protein
VIVGAAAVNALSSWLPAVLPAEARRFRALDGQMKATLADAGADCSGIAPDVEIAPLSELAGDARHAIISIDASQREGGALLVRAPRRAAAALRASLRARRTGKELHARGYDVVEVFPWDIDHLLYLPGVRDSRRGHPLAEWLPERAIVSGTRGAREPTMLEAVTKEAQAAAGGELRHGWPLARPAMLVVITDRGVLNVAVGQGRIKIELQNAALAALANAPAEVTQRLPRVIASGRTGLADWSLDSKLSGSAPPGQLPPALVAEAVDFLVALHEVDDPSSPAASIAADADMVASVCMTPENASRIRQLGEALERDLADVPRGFGHGDFWTHNLLVSGERLTGVIDWDGSGHRRLPMLDLLHLLLSAHRGRTREYFGRALVSYLLPSARAGGEPPVREYARRIGMALDADRLEALALAYWLDRMALEISAFQDRAHRPVWVRDNVEYVIESLGEHSLIPA